MCCGGRAQPSVGGVCECRSIECDGVAAIASGTSGGAALSSCYQNGPVSSGPMPMPVPPGNGLVCVSYSFRCTNGDTACTAEEQASGALRTAYIVFTRQTCAEMQNMGQVYMNVVCCGSNDCNAPGATAGKTGGGSVPCKGPKP
jgi:hypothetical protein